jgi:hypothetical protein
MMPRHGRFYQGLARLLRGEDRGDMSRWRGLGFVPVVVVFLWVVDHGQGSAEVLRIIRLQSVQEAMGWDEQLVG